MKIAIVGAGNGGTAILKSLSKIEGINIEIIVDTNLNAPGILLAKELGIKYSDSIDDINCNNLDMIIEATGVEKVSKLLNEKSNGKCKIIDSEGAFLIMTLVERETKTLEKLNSQMSVIADTSSVVQMQLDEITSSIKNIHNISENLLNTAEASNKYIEKSDKIVSYVNKIAQQIKILGLNANIEAARAGEHGKGFSVVANEIQKLANNSESFAKEINEMLVKLANEIRKINGEIDNLKKLSQVQLNASETVSSALERLKSETTI
ncbi:Methyl-accepting chemotaxis protein (MCP) signalling domain-containing protein [Caloranaerobacter azorensis DSM 13643]|uniref:Methyl-accepting chemotaxis protein (MCP) signalling domain-containing protein n=1 Tax=Caloranaerobacter azorensis DSM 13643 TaxID=1121264 RepID=A0A1M5UHC2_9FIRM|nr:methyl-accepting chemotaxis protein [Caloranaerobacter azorensis]SHH62414.1 Methyl-accepting chemotaxis protein (MCP) signalling domain-containing protein [Caloranaerobacter azorensis DSM 13643]